MKRKILVLLFIFSLLTITGCGKTKEIDKTDKKQEEDLKLNENEYSLSINETLKINEHLSILLLKVNDSRCPKNVECFWEGELEYHLLINGENYKISTVLNKRINYQDYLISIITDKCNENTLIIKVEKSVNK